MISKLFSVHKEILYFEVLFSYTFSVQFHPLTYRDENVMIIYSTNFSLKVLKLFLDESSCKEWEWMGFSLKGEWWLLVGCYKWYRLKFKYFKRIRIKKRWLLPSWRAWIIRTVYMSLDGDCFLSFGKDFYVISSVLRRHWWEWLSMGKNK